MNNLEIATAVEAARRTGGGFIFVREDAPPALADALLALAAETGREVLRVPGESPTMKAARQAAARDMPVVAGDNASFLTNHDNIASGKARVE